VQIAWPLQAGFCSGNEHQNFSPLLLGGEPLPLSTLRGQQDEVLEALVWHHAVQQLVDEGEQ